MFFSWLIDTVFNFRNRANTRESDWNMVRERTGLCEGRYVQLKFRNHHKIN